MTRFTPVALVAALVVVALGGWGLLRVFAADDSTLPQAGQMAPDFSLRSEEGAPVSLHSLRGKWVVLYFYPKDMTPGCTIEAHHFQRDLAQYHARNAVIVGVSVDSVDSHKRFCAKDSLGFTLLSDQHKKVVAEYGSFNRIFRIARRNTFLIDPHGRIVKVWTSVNPSSHSQEVLAALQSFEPK